MKLEHIKKDLEFFLQFNIAHIRFKPKKKMVMQDIVCTSNTQFIEVFSKLKESDKKKAAYDTKNNGIYTQDPKSILTFNLLDNEYNTIMLDRWEILCFLTIDSDDDVLLIDKYVNDMLKRPIERDLSKSKDNSK